MHANYIQMPFYLLECLGMLGEGSAVVLTIATGMNVMRNPGLKMKDTENLRLI